MSIQLSLRYTPESLNDLLGIKEERQNWDRREEWQNNSVFMIKMDIEQSVFKVIKK